MDTLRDDIERELDVEFGGAAQKSGPRQRAQSEIERRIVERSQSAAANPVAHHITIHRNAIAKHERDILSIERERDITIRGFEADLAEAERAFMAESGRLLRLIEEKRRESGERIAMRQRLKRSSQAALGALETNAAEREAPMQERRVPRPIGADIPPMVHTGINHL